MNFLKKKLKPLASSFQATNTAAGAARRDLEDDLYDEYVVEAPPHPSELIKLGVDPGQIDVNDPDRLRELYRQAKEQGKDKQTNSVLLARQRQKEQLEEKKRTREEWKFFDNLTSRVEQVVKESQRTLEQLSANSAVDHLDEPEYELRPSQVQVPLRPEELEARRREEQARQLQAEVERRKQQLARQEAEQEAKKRQLAALAGGQNDELDEFGCPRAKIKSQEPAVGAPGSSNATSDSSQVVAEVLLEDLGIDLRSDEQRRFDELKSRRQQASRPLDIKVAPRPRPRPASQAAAPSEQQQQQQQKSVEPEGEEDPFDTSSFELSAERQNENQREVVIDPFDTSYVKL